MLTFRTWTTGPGRPDHGRFRAAALALACGIPVALAAQAPQSTTTSTITSLVEQADLAQSTDDELSRRLAEEALQALTANPGSGS